MAKNKDLDAILRAFKAIPQATRKPINEAIHKGADEMVERMKYLAPESEGNLKRSIKKTEINEMAVRVSAGDENTMVVVNKDWGVEFDNAILQEYGTVHRPQSRFFWPSVNTLKKRVRRRVDRSIGKAVKDTWVKS